MPSLSHTILKDLCSLPTAPFVEHAVIAYATAFAKAHRLRLTRDPAGNLLLSLGPPPRKGQKRLVLAAHMDHPAFVSTSHTNQTLHAHFRGGVLPNYLFTAPALFFPPSGPTPTKPIRAKVISVSGSPYPTSAILQTPRNAPPIPPNTPGLFDLTPAKFTKTHFHSRVCDDLAGAAAALSALAQLASPKSPKPKLPFAVLLTRAEEVGFIGALAAVHTPPAKSLLRKSDDLLLAIECSAEQPYAPQHAGVILRVGDRTSIFNSSLTAFLHDTAQSIQKSDPTFKFQRALMPGGTCESTVYDAFNYHAAAVCLPLGNYHNMNRTTQSLAPENISLSDYHHMIQLFLSLAHSAHTYTPGHGPLKTRLTTRYNAQKHLLK